MLSKSRKDMYFGVIVLAIGVVYLGLTTQLPRSGGIDSATVPYFLAILMTVLGIVQIAAAAKNGRDEAERAKSLKSEIMDAAAPADKKNETAAPAAKADYKTVAITGILIFLYIALLDTFGFMIMSALYLFVQISLLTPKYAKANYGTYAIVAVLTAAVVYYLFYWAFDIMLPHGEFWYDRGIHMDWSPFE